MKAYELVRTKLWDQPIMMPLESPIEFNAKQNPNQKRLF